MNMGRVGRCGGEKGVTVRLGDRMRGRDEGEASKCKTVMKDARRG